MRREFLGPSWAILGPPWPFLGGPGGHLEADVGLGRLDLGVQGGQKLRCQKPKNLRKINVLSRFLEEATGPQKAYEVAREDADYKSALSSAEIHFRNVLRLA